MRPWTWDAEGSHVQAEVGWTVLEETTLAVLDHGLVNAHRAVADARASSCSTAAPAARITSRWRSRSPITSASTTGCCSRSGTSPSAGGGSTPTGIVVPLPLGHQRLADLVGAHRPSVTTALGELARGGLDLSAARTATGCCTARRRSSCATTSWRRCPPRGGARPAAAAGASVAASATLEAPGIEADDRRAGVGWAGGPDGGGVVAGGRRSGLEHLPRVLFGPELLDPGGGALGDGDIVRGIPGFSRSRCGSRR